MTKGTIIKINSTIYTVKSENNTFDCVLRGKFRYEKITPYVGDHVLFNTEDLVINEILERKNNLDRPPVANIDYNLIVTSLKKPDFNSTLLDKLISISEINNITPILLFTKLDLLSKSELKEYKKLFNYYKSIGYKVFTNKQVLKVKKTLKNKIVTVSGQTGAGKSTFINKLDNSLNLKTNDISVSLGRGKHTTRVVELFNIKNFYIMDTPGFSQIDFKKEEIDKIKDSFIEFNNYNCKYKDCKHIKEDGCSIKDNKFILKSRYDNYIKFIKGDNYR